MIAFAESEGRQSELYPIKGVVGKELSKHKKKKWIDYVLLTGFILLTILHTQNNRLRYQCDRCSEVLINERDRRDYYRPSTVLFRDFCQKEIIERYKLQNCVRHATVSKLSFSGGGVYIKGQGGAAGGDGGAFRIDLEGGEVLGARAVVLATGSQTLPCIPRCLSETGETSGVGFCHSTCLSRKGWKFPDSEVARKMKEENKTTLVVIGGGSVI
jgi:hypothetical protein